MAFIGQGWQLTLTFVDTAGDETTRKFDLVTDDDAGDLTAVIADVQTVVAAYIAASDAAVSKQTLSKTSVEDSFALPSGNVNVEDNLQISAKIFGTPNKSAVFEIPAPKNTLFVGATGEAHNKPDFADTALTNVVNLYKDGAQLFISDGESITDVNIKGGRVSHKRGRG